MLVLLALLFLLILHSVRNKLPDFLASNSAKFSSFFKKNATGQCWIVTTLHWATQICCFMQKCERSVVAVFLLPTRVELRPVFERMQLSNLGGCEQGFILYLVFGRVYSFFFYWLALLYFLQGSYEESCHTSKKLECN